MNRYVFFSCDYGEISHETWNAWEKHCSEWAAYPFQSPVWIRSYAERQFPKFRKRLFQAVEDGEKPVAYIPYAIHKVRTGGVLPIRYCQPWVDRGCYPAWASVSPRHDASRLYEVVEAFFGAMPPWDKMQTGWIQDHTDLHQAFLEVLKKNRMVWKQQIHETSEIRGFSDFSGFVASLSKDWRRRHRQLTKKFLETGVVTTHHYHSFSDDRQLTSLCRRMAEIYAESWKSGTTFVHANLAGEVGLKEFTALLRSFAERSGVHIVLSKVRGEDAAFYAGVHSGGVYCSLQTAFKKRFSDLSVGFLTQMENFKYTTDKQFSRNNLLDRLEYKTHLTELGVRFLSYTIFNRTARGRLSRALSDLRACRRRIGL